MGILKRAQTIFQAKANDALDKAEDPRQTLDLSYEQQFENLTKVKRAVADVATAKKRIEIQAEQLKSQGDKLAEQAKAALGQGNEALAREALTRREAIAASSRTSRLNTRSRRSAAEVGSNGDKIAEPDRSLPHAERDDQGDLHRCRGLGARERSREWDLDVHGRRWRRDAARPGQGRRDASAQWRAR